MTSDFWELQFKIDHHRTFINMTYLVHVLTLGGSVSAVVISDPVVVGVIFSVTGLIGW